MRLTTLLKLVNCISVLSLAQLLGCSSSEHRAFAEAACDAYEACGTLDEVFGTRDTCLKEKRKESRQTYREYKVKYSVACANAEYEYRLCHENEHTAECNGSETIEGMWCETEYWRFLDTCEQ